MAVLRLSPFKALGRRLLRKKDSALALVSRSTAIPLVERETLEQSGSLGVVTASGGGCREVRLLNRTVLRDDLDAG